MCGLEEAISLQGPQSVYRKTTVEEFWFVAFLCAMAPPKKKWGGGGGLRLKTSHLLFLASISSAVVVGSGRFCEGHRWA